LKLYLDTSVLVTALTYEASTQRVQDWLGTQDPTSLHISYWVETEFSSALAMKIRTGQLTLDMRAVSLSDYEYLKTHSLTMADVKPSHFLAAAKLADNFEHALRAPRSRCIAFGHCDRNRRNTVHTR
jgi:uncharacterized protein